MYDIHTVLLIQSIIFDMFINVQYFVAMEVAKQHLACYI